MSHHDDSLVVECEPSKGFGTVVTALQNWYHTQPEKVVYRWLEHNGKETAAWTYGELHQRAQAVAQMLRSQQGVVVGDRVILMYLPGLEFMAAFWGCQYAGAIAVPVCPVDVASTANFRRDMSKFERIVESCEPKLVLTHNAYSTLKTRAACSVLALERQAAWPKDLVFMNTDNVHEKKWTSKLLYEPKEEDLAFLQFTSGSTGKPKGVMVSHSNLHHNVLSLQQSMGADEDLCGVCWCPSFHDAGLIGHIILSAFVGGTCVNMSPLAFVSDPPMWLEAISKYKGTHTCAPNFAYELCANKVDEARLAKMDLSSMTWFGNGAEPIRASTIRKFVKRFEVCGLKPGALSCCWGMAEIVVFGTGRGPILMAPSILCVDRTILQEQGVVVPLSAVEADAEDVYTTELVGCGHAGWGNALCIVDPDTFVEKRADEVGEIWVSGPSNAQGYWGCAELSKETFEARVHGDKTETNWLRTGDLGFLHKGELFVCGRKKDVVIVHGCNYYPQDIETVVSESHEQLRPGCLAVFALEV